MVLGMKWEPPKQLELIEQRYSNVRDEAIEFIKQEITEFCDINGYEFSCLYFCNVLENGEPLDHMTLPLRLVHWFEENFLVTFPECVYENGEWRGI